MSDQAIRSNSSNPPRRSLCSDCAGLGIPGALCTKHAAADILIGALETTFDLGWYPHDLYDPHCNDDACVLCAMLHRINDALQAAQAPASPAS